MSNEPLPKEYDAHEAARRWSAAWNEAGVYVADPAAEGEPFSIVIPPPNVTGALHMGHALNNTLQDLLIRYKRMDGYNAVWIPGTDHAGIATQRKVKEKLADDGVDVAAMSRDDFVEQVWAWKHQYGDRIRKQLEAMAVSCDWTRERFTLDEGLQKAVTEHFVQLYEDGLIYRGERLINWDPVDQTALSDIEVDNEETTGELYSFAYPLADGSGEVVVATTRPETLFGDTAVAVHPDDERYQHLIGQLVQHPFVDRQFPIVADRHADPEKGTGCVKITPAHDFNDFEVGQRHGLPMPTVMHPDGTMNALCGDFAGMDRFACRKAVKKALEERGLARGSEPNPMVLPRGQRSGAVVEPRLSTQWFVSMKALARPAVAAVEQGRTRFVPEQWQNTYFAWLRDLHDWCISRQLWWGHRIPAWYDADGRVYVARTFEQAVEQAGHDQLRQDDDVLDTWFSSALWPFSTMGWPDRTADFDRWYPTSVLCTAPDIIFFWVARMMFAGLHFTGSVPFHDVYIHALVRDDQGRKMSKSLGNGVDPLDVIADYGADAFRYTLVAFAARGRDIRWDAKHVEDNGKFLNKIWNALRFAFLTGEGYDPSAPMELGPYEGWIRARTGAAVARTRQALDDYRFNDAAAEIYAFTWGEFCDWYLELSKTTLYDDEASDARKNGTRHVLFDTLATIARLLHPIMPFFTEELWSRLPGTEGFVTTATYPKADEFPTDDEALAALSDVQAAIVEVRRIRGEMELGFKQTLTALVADAELLDRLQAHARGLQHLANVVVEPLVERPKGTATAVVRGHEIVLPLAGVVDLAAEVERLDKALAKADKDIAQLGKRLGNPSFVDRAPADVVAEVRAKHDAAVVRRDTLAASRDRLADALE